MTQNYSLKDFRLAFEKFSEELLSRRQFYEDTSAFFNMRQCAEGTDLSLQSRLCDDLIDFASSLSSFLMSLRMALEQALPEYHVAAQSHLSVLFHIASKVSRHKLKERRAFREIVGADYHAQNTYRLMLRDMSQIDIFCLEHLRPVEHLLRVQLYRLELKPEKRSGFWSLG